MVWTPWAWLAACSDPTITTNDGVTPSTDDPSTAHSGLSTSETGATESAHTGAPTTDSAEAFDCRQVPEAPVAFRKLPWAPTAEDFTLSADADMITVTGGLLKRTPFGGPPVNVAPGFGDVRGTRFLPDGRLALAHPEDGSVWVADLSTGGHTVAAGNLTTPNGIAIHPDGLIYVATA
ncbi:MAG: hypothetical protein KC621_05015, partial [Myxococcales bacterium]|nr:hypothetical protein [Myxococcales bacterium]